MLNNIKQDQLKARKDYLSTKLPVFSLKSKLLTTVLGEATMPGKETDISKIITKFIKNANEIIKVGNTHQVVQATNEIAILEKYLPKQLSESKLKELINGMSIYLENMKVGTVMKELNKEYKGKFNAKMAVDIINGRA